MANTTAQAAFGRLFGADGALLPALTILLTLYVALFAFALITGRSRIGVAALTPRMLTLGLVLTFATSWVAYQSVIWNLAVGAPDEIASILMGTRGSSTEFFADKIDIVFAALAQLSNVQSMQGAQSTFSPQGLLWMGATMLLLGTVGVLATCKIALAILLALGPVFVVLALFRGTRGLFTGWLKGVTMLVLAPLFAVLGGSLMLEMAIPVLGALAQTPGKIEPQQAMAFFIIGAIHLALMVMVLKVSGTMVSGWTVFGLARSLQGQDVKAGTNRSVAQAPMSSPGLAQGHLSAPRHGASERQIRLPTTPPSPANDVSPATQHGRNLHVATVGAYTSSNDTLSPSTARARGVGSRFRAPAPTSLARSMEKSK